MAVENKNEPAVQVLLEYGADPHLLLHSSRNSSMFAAFNRIEKAHSMYRGTNGGMRMD